MHTVWVSNCFIWSIDRTLSFATSPSQSGPESAGNKGVPHSPNFKSWILTIRFFNVIFTTLVGGSYSSDLMQSAYSTVPVDWVVTFWPEICEIFILTLIVFVPEKATWSDVLNLKFLKGLFRPMAESRHAKY